MNALEAESNGEQVYTTLLHNMVDVKNILATMMETIPEDQLQRTPGLRQGLNMENVATLQTQEREREEHSYRSRSGRYPRTRSDAAYSGHNKARPTPIADAHDQAPHQDL